MLRNPFFLLCICLTLLITAYDASAKTVKPGAAEYSTKSTKAAKVKAAGVSKKEAAQASDKPGLAGGAKKSSKKNKGKSAAKYQLRAKSAHTKAATGRKAKKSSRDPASLPVALEGFDETPHSVLAALSTLPTDGDISSSFGMRRLSPKKKRTRMHTGVDIMAAHGTPVLAAASGVVRFVGRWSAYGKIVELDHGNGLVTRYAHLDTQTVREGDTVASGEQIGTVGRTGRTTGAHLHFETLVNGRRVDPMQAEMWQQTPAQLAAKRGTYVAELGNASKPAY